MDMSLDIFIEIMVSTLLLITLGYCYVLNKQLQNIRNNNQEFASVIETMTTAAKKAENVIYALKIATLDAEKKIDEQDDKTKILKSELSLLVKAAENLALRRKEIQTARKDEKEIFNKKYTMPKMPH